MDYKNNIDFTDKFILSNDSIELLDKGTNIKKILTSTFEKDLKYLEIFFGILIIVMAIGNGYTTYIKNNTNKFIIETISYGIIGTIPVLYMEKYRNLNGNHNYLTLFITTFFLYVACNLLLELSGTYYFFYEKQEPILPLSKQVQESQTEDQKIINNTIYSVFFTIGIIIVILIIIMIIIAYKIHDFNIEAYNGHLLSSFTIEMLIFALLNSLPFFVIAYNREDKKFNLKKNSIEVGLIFIKFALLHILLQASGFFKQTLGY